MKSYRQNYEQLWTASTKQDEQQHSIQIKFVSELQSHEMSVLQIVFTFFKHQSNTIVFKIEKWFAQPGGNYLHFLCRVFKKDGCCKLSVCGFLLYYPYKYAHIHLIGPILVQLDHENFQLLLSCDFKDLILSEFLFIQNCSQNNNKVIL